MLFRSAGTGDAHHDEHPRVEPVVTATDGGTPAHADTSAHRNAPVRTNTSVRTDALVHRNTPANSTPPSPKTEMRHSSTVQVLNVCPTVVFR